MTILLKILWHESEIKNYVDMIPYEDISSDGERKGVIHTVVGPSLKEYKAQCNISVNGTIADLDYSPFKEFNAKDKMVIGVMRIQFIDSNKNEVVQVLWKGEGDSNFQTCSTSVSFNNSLSQELEKAVKISIESSSEERIQRMALSPKKPSKFKTFKEDFKRNPDVIAEALFRANGVCQICKKPAPFNKKDTNEPYLEVHHKIFLSNGGDDTIENAIALCPNCHREKHYGVPTEK